MNLLQYIIIGTLCICIAYKGRAQSEMPDGNSNDGPPEMVTIDAALSYQLPTSHYLLLFSGNKAHSVINNQSRRIHDREIYLVPADMKLQAAYARPGRTSDKRYFGDKYGVNVIIDEYSKRFKYGPQRAFLRNGGPDAAAKRKTVVYFFKGCKMAVRYKFGKWGKVQETSSVGLPCDIHAAWTEEFYEKMVVLKGDQYWTWEKDNSVTGPHDFNANYPLGDWIVAPVT